MHMCTSRVVPGRKNILILQPYFLEEHDGSHYLPKARRTAPFYRRGVVHAFTFLRRTHHNMLQERILKAYGLFSDNEEREARKETDKTKQRKVQRDNRPLGSKRSAQTAQERLAENEEAQASASSIAVTSSSSD